MCMEDIRIARKMRMGIKNVSLGPQILMPLISRDESRVGIVLPTHDTADINYYPSNEWADKFPLPEGILVPADTQPLIFNIRDHGPLCIAPWVCSSSGAAEITIIEWFLGDL